MTTSEANARRGWGLTRRLVVIVIATVTLVLGLFVGLTAIRLEGGAAKQQQAVSKLAEERIGEQMRLQNRLIVNELQQMRKQTDNEARSLAALGETVSTIERGNIVAIDLMLNKAVSNSSLDGLIALDVDLKALGSHRPGLVLAYANAIIAALPVAKRANEMISQNTDPENAANTVFERRSKSHFEALGIETNGDKLALVSVQPVKDDFGDVTALLVAHRIVDESSGALARFVKDEGLGLRIKEGDAILMDAGLTENRDRTSSRNTIVKNGPNGRTIGDAYLFQCLPFGNNKEICIYESMSKLTRLTGAFVDFINTEKRSLMIWLVLLAVASIVISTITASQATRRVLAPLQQITRAVRSVAKGNWLIHVAGQRRRDEVGDIAQAVVVLQQWMKERERLKADVADIEQLKARQQSMDSAAQHCQQALRQRLFGLSDLADTVETGAKKLEGLAGLAEGEADEARLVSVRMLTGLSNAPVPENKSGDDGQSASQLIVQSIDRLSETVGVISEDSRTLSQNIATVGKEVHGVDRAVKDLMRAIEAVAQTGSTVRPREEA